jgi:serine/threonine protein kinase
MSEWSVPGYTGLRVLGSGGFGQVMLARHDASGVPVAIKYLHRELLADREFLGMFRDEAAVLANLQDPHIVRLYEYVESPWGAAIVMELIDGVSLQDVLTRLGGTTPEAALVVLQGSLLGLAAAHQRGVVHRDYKPANVLISQAGLSKLTDFGIAARAGTRPVPAGTLRYAAPEQMDGGPASPASDIYAATATFYECVTGRPPFDGGFIQRLDRHADTDTVPLEPVPAPLRPLITAGMAMDPRRRPADAISFITQLRAAAFGAYGADWEERGRSRLAEAALLLALLWPSAQAPAVQGGTAEWVTMAPHPGRNEESRPTPHQRHQRHVLHVLHLQRLHWLHLRHQLHLRRRAVVAVAVVAVVGAAAGTALAVGLNRSGSPQPSPTQHPGPPPAISGISPASGNTAGGTAVTISGAGLSGTTKVTFGDKPAKIIHDPPAQITVMSPPGTGTVHISLVTPAGRATSVGVFTYVSPVPHPPRPAVTTIAPASGSSAGGTVVTISGTGLYGATEVRFGRAAGMITADSSTRITVVSPPAAGPGQVPLSVTTAGGTSAVTARADFTYRAAAHSAKASQAISFTSVIPAHAVVGGQYVVAATGGKSGAPVLFSIDSASGPGVCASSGTDGAAIRFKAAGICVIDAVQAGDDRYLPAPQAQQTVAVNDPGAHIAQAITFTSAVPAHAVAGGTYQVTATGGSSGNPVIFTVGPSSAGVCTISNRAVTFNKAGQCVIDANQAGDARYLAAPQAQQTVAVSNPVTRIAQAITFTSRPPAPAFAGGTYAVTATGGGSGNPVVFSVDPSSAKVCSVSDGTVTFTAVGDCVIDADQAGNARYLAAPQAQQAVTVSEKAAQVIAFTSQPPARVFAGGTYAVTATGGGSGNPVVFSIDPASAKVCSLSDGDGTTVVAFTAAGDCVIDANQAGGAQYLAAPQARQAVTVSEQAAQAITFTSQPPARVFADETYAVAATGGGSGNPVVFTIDPASAAACSVSDGTVTFTAAGDCVIDANEAGGAQYLAAPQAQQTVTVAEGTVG